MSDEVVDLPLAIIRFTADPTLIKSGHSSLLEWETEGATRAEINGYEVPFEGLRKVSPRRTTKYVLKIVKKKEEIVVGPQIHPWLFLG